MIETALVSDGSARRSWGRTVRLLLAPPVFRLLFLGFSAGLPYLLIFGTLSIWLTEAGIQRSTVTMLSWAALAFSFKFAWAPLVDRMPLPGLTRLLGRRRAWLLLSQLCVCASLVATGFSDPLQSLTVTAMGAVAIAFSAATQDIVIDAYRIEAAEPDLQSMMAATYQAGYRAGMLVSGAGALWLAGWLGTSLESYSLDAWALTYWIMAGLMGIGVVTTLFIPEPPPNAARDAARGEGDSLARHLQLLVFVLLGAGIFILSFLWFGSVRDGLRASGTGLGAFLAAAGPFLGAMVEALRFVLSGALALGALALLTVLRPGWRSNLSATYFSPVADFFDRYGRLALLILLLIGTYRISDIVMGAVANVFYTEMTFTKEQIALYTKVWGVVATLVGGFVGGIFALRRGVMSAMFMGALFVSVTNLLFAVLAHHPGDELYLAIAITGDNFAGGFAGAAFIAYLSALTSVQFTAMQYALFSSLMTLGPKILAGYSGSMVTAFGYDTFFVGCAIIGLPVLLLVVLAARYAPPGRT
ncbi:MFS transporter [Phaeovibrio sulfidiphilus]|uniref:MFS transporter n=1 Tax=Phaeovibrio sulfidiphilus TaxID=1220600 RepID=A0A8J6YLQ7_9PROT|nr:MFS transporter [Phaeovibrio sulfidiphilus]MBE1236710.1 MFS transporter [Phaeovibrio sulfidiphilus]